MGADQGAGKIGIVEKAQWSALVAACDGPALMIRVYISLLRGNPQRFRPAVERLSPERLQNLVEHRGKDKTVGSTHVTQDRTRHP